MRVKEKQLIDGQDGVKFGIIFKEQQTIPIREQSKNQWQFFRLIIYQQMKEASAGYTFNPHSIYSFPFTIISQAREHFTSKSTTLPCVFEVYCPYSCKKIKIGLTKDGKTEELEFNTTTLRTVSVFANDSLRFLVNKHKPNKKDKKAIVGQGWGVSIDVQDKGNVAIFNPYCIDPLQPLTFYTFDKFIGTEKPKQQLIFAPIVQRQAKIITLGGQKVYISTDLKWIGLNAHFAEKSSQKITINNPNNINEELTGSTKSISTLCFSYLFYYLSELHKIMELQQKDVPVNASLLPANSVDRIYKQITFYLNILQQIRARLMNDYCYETYKQIFKQHPRLYSAFERLGSFLNYGNTKYNPIKLAELGFYNKSDMLQDISYVELPMHEIFDLEAQNVTTEEQLRRKMFPFARMVRHLPFPNVDLKTTLTSLHCQQTAEGQILKWVTSDPYIAMVSSDAKVSLWSCELMPYKMIQFDLTKDFASAETNISESSVQKQKSSEVAPDQKQSEKTREVGTQTAAQKQEDVQPDENLLKQLELMGYKPSLAKKALIQTKNQQLDVVIDFLSQMGTEEPKKKPKKQWNCSRCTYKNGPNVGKCQMCDEEAPDEEDSEKKILKALQQARKDQEQLRKKQAEQRAQKDKEEQEQIQKLEKDRLEKIEQQKKSRVKNSIIKAIEVFRTNKSNIDPFFVAVLLQTKDEKDVVRLFRVGLNRKHLNKFYRIEDDYIVSNFTRQIISKNNLENINNLISRSRQQIEWGIKFFESSTDSVWTVIQSIEISVNKPATNLKIVEDVLYILNNNECIQSHEISLKDTLVSATFEQVNNQQKMIKLDQKSTINEQVIVNQGQMSISPVEQNETSIIIPQNVEEVYIEVRENLPAGKWKNFPKNKQAKVSSPIYAQNLIMSQFLPLKIESYEGSIFSQKYSTSSMLQKSIDKNNIYVSNYPNVSFIFKSIDNKPIFIESVTVISKNVKMNKIYPICSGLIFTANEASWFAIAKQRFSNFTKEMYEDWLKAKQIAGQTIGFWEPVAYFDLNNQAEFEIHYKRIAKLAFLLPLSVNKKQSSDQVIAVRIDFFGVKGRVEDEVPETQLLEAYKNDGTTDCKIQLTEESSPGTWSTIQQQKWAMKSATSINGIAFSPKYLQAYSESIPVSTTSIYLLKFKNLSTRKRLCAISDHLTSIKLVSSKKSHAKPERLNIKNFSELITTHQKLSNVELETIINELDLNELVLSILKGSSDITHYENLLTRVLGLNGYDRKVLTIVSNIVKNICSKDVQVTEIGFKSFLRFHEKILNLDEQLSKKTIEESWQSTIAFSQKCRNKNYNILRNSYQIQELVLESALFSKDYYRLINPNYVEQQKPLSLSTEPTTPLNNRTLIECINNFSYVYYVDFTGHSHVNSLELYFPKFGSPIQDNRYKMELKITEINNEGKQKQVYWRYFHEDYLQQLSSKAFKDTEIFTRSLINYCSIPGQLFSADARIVKLHVNFLMLTTYLTPKYKPLTDHYIVMPFINSSTKIQLKPETNLPPLPNSLSTYLSSFPSVPKHNYCLERVPPHKYAHENKKMLYLIHQFKNKSNSIQVKSESANKIQKIIQNILDKTIVTDVVSQLKINDFVLGHKGLDFGYILMINLYKLFKKLTNNSKVDVKIMFMLFDAFIVHEYGPIKTQTASILVQLYNRLDSIDQNLFVGFILDNYLMDTEKIKNMKISEKYPVQKILKFLYDINLPVALLFQKLKSANQVSSMTLLILLISNNKATNPYENLNIYSEKEVRKMKIHQLLDVAFKTCNWILENSSALISEILELSLNLFLSFFNQKSAYKATAEDVKLFMQNLQQQEFWTLIFGTLRRRNDGLNDKIDQVFKVLVENIDDRFQKGINNMLLEIIKKGEENLYDRINPNITDDARMNHLKTILEYLSLTNKKIFLDTDTAVSLLQLPLTATLWSLALKIIPREDRILVEIIKKFSDDLYSSLGTEIMEFCEPMAGMRKLQSNHINWLDLVKKIRIQNRTIFQLFIEKLSQCNFGGKSGLSMAITSDIIKLEIADEFAKLVTESNIEQKSLTEQNIRILISWFFLNYTKDKGISPATDLLLSLSKSMFAILEKITHNPSTIPKFIKAVLENRKQGQILEALFQQKKISSSNALQLNKRFSECFELLINLLCINDEMFNYFAFEVDGLKYLLEKTGLSGNTPTKLRQMNSLEGEGAAIMIPQQEFLISEGLIASKQSAPLADKSVPVIELKQQQFAQSVQLVPNKNAQNITSSTADWTVYKKANKTKIIFLPMTGPTHNEFPLFISLNHACEVRSIKIGFPAASYEFNDKLVASPSSVLLEGGMDLKNLQTIGEMEQVSDDGYACNGVRVFVINLQKIKNSKKYIKQSENGIADSILTLGCFKVKYLKIIVKRPVVTFIEGQYSPLNGKPYTNLGCNISFLSVLGDSLQKRKITLLNLCKQISKSSSLNILGTVISQSNSNTVKRISHSPEFISNFKSKFNVIKQHMVNYSAIVPNIVYSLGASNEELGDWIIQKFLSEGNGDTQAKLLNQIVVSSSKRIYVRLDIFLNHVLKKVKEIVSQSQIEANIKYSESCFFIESFCKTLEQSYDFSIEEQTVLHCTFENIEQIITLYDRKYSSPEIKTFARLLINLLYLHHPLRLSEDVQQKTLNLIWQNCSQAKPYFYDLLGTLLVNKRNVEWIQEKDHEKIKQLIVLINKSVDANAQKCLAPQMFLLWVLSFHEKAYLAQNKVHLSLYNKIKQLTLASFEIYDYMVKLIQNVVLDDEAEQKQMAVQLIEDVDLLVRRKDQNLQQLYVGILRLQKQINVNLKGFDVDSRSTKKDSFLNSKILNKAHLKSLSQKINKKIKFNLVLESQSALKSQFYDRIYAAINSSQFLLVLKLKLTTGKFGYVGCYCPGRSWRSEQDSYCWEDVLNYEKGAFIFTICDGETKFIQSAESGEQMLSLFGGEDEMDESLTFLEKGADILKLPLSSSGENNITLPSFVGAKVESIEIFNGVIKPSIMEPKLLALSNKATTPFSYYRTSSIYVFPYRISVEKFLNIIGIKGKCEKHKKAISNDQLLGTIGDQSEDFIADIEVRVEESEENAKQEVSYFPTMKIFDKFSQLGGVSKVLDIGSQSIKDWRKPQRRKCFQHYMSELKNFVHLPSFFNHYIKNQQSISFLFEVASGMPDDPSNEKNWEQEEVKSSKFIYKILADIYKFDRSLQIRDMNKYSQFCELILQKLAQISKQTVRSNKNNEAENSEANQKSSQSEKQKSSVNTIDKKKKKGIGYSSDNQNSSKWTATEWMEYRKNINEEIQRVASIFVSFLDCQKPLTDAKLSEIIKNSCLLPLIESALRSGSLLDISKEADLFRSYLNILKSLASNPSTVNCLLEIDPSYKPVQTESIFKLLTKLHGIAQIFIDCLKSGKSGQENQTAAIIAAEIEKVFYVVDKAVKRFAKNTSTISIKQINSMPTPQAYRLLLSSLRFGYVDMKKKEDYQHFYSTTIPKGTPPTAKILRLSQELADLSSSLPCQNTNSIFVRCDKSRIDVIKILIMGSKDTPYSNGAFMFDLFCDDSYPNNPPKMSITTTGSGKIRFNPNLYACGKVCLSLLGTWRGQASQNWDAKISTLLQLFISTQGITMSEDLYFNEPGFDSEQGTVQGERKNEAYSNIVRIGNVRYAMNQQIKNPPKGFEEVVNRHFYVKQKQILEQVEKWIEMADKKQASYVGLVNDHNTTWCTDLKVKGKYKQLLVKEYEELKSLLSKLPEPNLKQKQQESTVIEAQKTKKKIKVKEAKLGEIDVSYDPQVQKQLGYEDNVMQDRWSRYIGAMGIEAVKKQAASKVILVGLKTLGLEIAKNLVLSGLKELTIVDSGVYSFGSEEHFYLSDVKSRKIEECIFKIKELNPYMLVKSQAQMPALEGYHIVVSTLSLSQSKQIAQKCRKSGVKFIHAQSCGASGFYFADLGKQFIVEDPNGEQPFEGMIKQISCAEEGVVKLLDGVKHPYQDGDYIVLDKVEGMKQLQNKIEQVSQAQKFYNEMSKSTDTGSINRRLFKIKVLNWNSFSIGDTTNFQPYVKGGLCRNINIPKKMQFMPFEQSMNDFDKYLDPSVGIYDFEKMNDNWPIFACYQAHDEFITKNKRKIKNWQLKDAEQFDEILKKIALAAKKTQQQTQNLIKFGRKFSTISEAELPVLGAYFGGLVSQQIIKAITNKYTPIKQFFTFHFNEMIQDLPQNSAQYVDLQIKQNESFPNLKIVIGRQNSKKIEKMKTFVIGAGAIGCELLKNFAMINMGAEGMITVTDPDHIQTSNLTRQFLFRQKHVKKPKSATAAATLIQMNPLLKNHISARLDKVSQQTEDIYSDQFFESQTVVANALDNVKARVYVDSRCVTNCKPLFESGTLGPKGHVQVIVPHKTENYGNQTDPTEESQIPHCTLKMFPEETEHCIEWSRDIFGKVFTLNPKALKKVIEAKDVSVAQGQQKSTVSKMLQHKPQGFDDCIAEAVRKFYKYFRNNVRQLLHTYPLDMKTKDGKLFWSLPKRPPKQINEIDFSDPVHQKFIVSYAVLLAKIYQLPYPKDFRQKEQIQHIMSVAKGVKPQQFIPSQEESQKLQKMTQKQQKSKQTDKVMQEQQTQQIAPVSVSEPKIELTNELLQINMQPEQFEKDQDSNGHIDLIYAMSNLRARNYGINQCTWIEAKLKAGKIMAALSTTTSVVAALQTIQIMKIVAGSKQYRNAFINLAIPIIQISQPGEVPKHKIGNTQFTVWDTWEFKADTLNDLLKQISDKYDVEGYNISTAGGVPIYWQAMYVDKQEAAEQLLNRPLNKIIQEKTALNIVLRSKTDKKPFENVPKIIVQPPLIMQSSE